MPPAPPDHPLTILFRPDPHLWDGRYANNAWLQELPRPLTKLTWDNPLLISPEQARKLKLRNGDKVTPLDRRCRARQRRSGSCRARRRTASWRFWASAGRDVGTVGSGAGFDFYPLTGRADAPSLQKVAGHVDLACTDHHNLIFDAAGDIVRHGTLAELRQGPALSCQRRAASRTSIAGSPRGRPPGR